MANRVDSKMVELGLAQSREIARALIIEGVVLLDGVRVMKPSDTIRDGQILSLKENPIPFVSRGGLKLEKALRNFGVDPTGYVCSDSGASTGGFTDCLLQQGASKVFAIDVGYGQLAWKIRNDPRVVVMERTNIRYVTPEDLGELLDLSVVDVSFISLKHIFPVAQAITAPDTCGVCLVKPQFEAGREKVGKKGVVREISTHIEVMEAAAGYPAANGFAVEGMDFSPVKGPEGNIEFLMFVRKSDAPVVPDHALFEQVAQAAHENLDKSHES